MSTPLIIILAIVSLLVFILVLPVHLSFSLYGDDVCIFVRILFFKYTIYPEKEKKEKKKVTKTKKEKPKDKKEIKPKEKKEVFTLEEKITYITKLSRVIIDKIKKHLVIRLKDFEIVVATGDAAKTAIIYGSVCGGLSALFAILYESMNFKISQKAKGVSMDFLSDKMIINFKLDFCVNIIKGLLILLPTAMEYIKIKSNEEEEK